MLTATLNPSSATGTVTFTIGSTHPLTALTVAGGTATLTNIGVYSANGFTPGTASISASYSGDSNFAATQSGVTVQVAAAPTNTTTTTMVTASPSSVTLGGSIALLATVSPSSATGTVTFTLGNKNVGVVPVSGGQALLSSVAVTNANGFTSGVDTITATFAGSPSTYLASTNTTSVIATIPTYTLSTATPSVSTTAGNGASVTLNLVSQGYAGMVSFTTSIKSSNGTAANVAATASPVVLTAGGTGTSTLTVTTNSSAANHAPAFPWKDSGTLMLGTVLLGAPLTMRRKQAAVGMLLISLVLLAGSMACAVGTGTSPMPVAPTPSERTYTILVTPTVAGAETSPPPVSVVVTVQ
jgi:hypothetical protein